MHPVYQIDFSNARKSHLDSRVLPLHDGAVVKEKVSQEVAAVRLAGQLIDQNIREFASRAAHLVDQIGDPLARLLRRHIAKDGVTRI